MDKQVRVLVSTRKGGFILSSDEERKKWQIKGPLFSGLEVTHMKGSAINPDRIYAAQMSKWFGQLVYRSDDGGENWVTVGNHFPFRGVPHLHKDFGGKQTPWKFRKIWVFEPSLVDADTVYAGVEDAALFKSTDGGITWEELESLRSIRGDLWMPESNGLGLHTILTDSKNPDKIIVGISAAGAFRTLDGGLSWKPINYGLRAVNEMPDSQSEVGFCVHKIARHLSSPEVLFMQKHWDVMRSDNGGDLWYKISGNLPSDFGFPIAIHAHEAMTIYVIPMQSDLEHFPPDGKLRVYRSQSGGNQWEELSSGLPQENCYVNVLRGALAVDNFPSCGIYFGTTGGQVYVSSDSGDNWQSIVEYLPGVLSIEVQTFL